MARILILHPQRSARKLLEERAGKHHEVSSVGDIRSALKLIDRVRPALVVAGQNFDVDVVTYLMVIAVIGLVILMPAAGELGKRMQKAE